MTKRKGTSDLLADICEHEASMPDPLYPPHDEPEGQHYAVPALAAEGTVFERFKQALRAGDHAAAIEVGRQLNYPPRLVEFLADVVRTEAEMTAAVPDLPAMVEQIQRLDDEIGILVRTSPGTLKEAGTIHERLTAARTERNRLAHAHSVGEVARNKLFRLRAWGGCLFGYATSGGCIEGELANAAKKLDINPSKHEDWRLCGCPPQAPRRRRARLRTGFGQS